MPLARSFRRWFPWLVLGTAGSLPAQITVVRPAVPDAGSQPRQVLAIGSVAAPRVELARSAPATAAAIERGLGWLLARQQTDGRWDCDGLDDGAGRAVHDIAVTGLALLALAREGAAARTEPRREAMLRGVHWLALQQQENGLLGPRATHDFIYDHATATLGLAAAAAATGSAEAGTALRAAVGYLETHRNPYMVWRYMPRDGDNDTSVTTWATLACLAAREVGVEAPAPAFDAVRQYLKQVTDADGRTGYARAGEPSSRARATEQRFPPQHGEAMTAAGILCRSALGESLADDGPLAAGIRLVLAKPPSWEPGAGKVDLCYWFFASEALRRAGGAGRAAWTDALQQALSAGQRDDGSWDAIDPWGQDGGRLYSTALAVLALQALYDVPALQPQPAAPPSEPEPAAK
ncbi:MAG: hypothetical protein JNL08_18150 [Planctomycetes bacterium]|nr:hypothetical protein [Planctomycetota bacterium]